MRKKKNKVAKELFTPKFKQKIVKSKKGKGSYERKSKFKNAIKKMDSLIKSKEKEKAKKYFSKFQSILMQVAKSGVINKKTAARKISRVSKKI